MKTTTTVQIIPHPEELADLTPEQVADFKNQMQATSTYEQVKIQIRAEVIARLVNLGKDMTSVSDQQVEEIVKELTEVFLYDVGCGNTPDVKETVWGILELGPGGGIWLNC